jgi:peroxiredoxin
MSIKTPMCDFGQAAKSFELKSTNNKIIKLNDVKGENGTLVMFICNHCPYVIAVIEDIIEDSKDLEKLGIKTVAICSNESINYPDDSFEKMIEFHNNYNFNFPYLIDETQELQYRGRIRELKNLKSVKSGESDLFKAMKQIAETDMGPKVQIPSMGCSIKWLNN